MGKPKQTKKDKASSAAPKCTCDHPFDCSCGNRPPRPSRGHKWDPETQEWGGKGHKQKGASGQTASIGQQAKTTEVGRTQIAQWQALPSSILREYCQRQKRPPPRFKELMNDPNSNPPKFKVRVIVPDPKNDPDRDLILIPAKPVSNGEQAMEEAALLALLQLTPNLPHERKLPEPYKTTWLNASRAHKDEASNKAGTRPPADGTASSSSSSSADTRGKLGTGGAASSAPSSGPAASSNTTLALGTAFTSLAGRRKHAEEEKNARNARIRRHEAVRRANRNHPVFLSARLRAQIQQLLRGNTILDDDDGQDGNQTVDDDAINRFDSDLQGSVEGRLHNEGFTKRQARTAFEKKGLARVASAGADEQEWDHVYEDCLQWLCVHLDEDQLPEGFDPRGQTLEVVGTDSSATSQATAVASKFGISARDAKWMIQQHGKNGGSLSFERIFWDRICEIAGRPLESTFASHDDSVTNLALLDDELEAIESMFPSDLVMTTSSDGKYSTIVINTTEGLNIHFTFLRGKYPAVFPEQVLFLGEWEQPASVAFHVEMVKFISTLALGEPMLFEIYGHSQSLLQGLEDLPSLALATTANVITKDPPVQKPISQPSTAKQRVRNPNSIHKRPRIRSPFWSKLPGQTPPAKTFCWSPSIERQRKSLPAWKARDAFLAKLDEASKSSRVVLCTGETGCGKSTQIPQFILEENPSSCKIVVAQPRRLAATGVAARVAEERGENQPGEASVGYVVRGATAMSKDTRLMFCTFGILLRQLQSEGALDAVTHVVVDEVHERNLDGDVLMGLLRESLKTLPHLKVILMSATLDADRFAAYWGNAPTIHIPGRTFPVEDFMLEDVLLKTNYIPPKKRRNHRGYSNMNYSERPTGKPPSEDSEKSDAETSAEEEGEEKDDVQNQSATSVDSGGQTPQLEDRLKRIDQDVVDYDLLGLLIKSIVQSNDMGNDGSILVFLQGVGEIAQAKTVIGKITRGLPVMLLPLHGGLQPKEQVLVFRKTPNQVKVILSTNVAETSITIPDCTIVIDSCREKQSSYDPINRMPLLLDCFASKASLKQRRGRAGRVRSGKCYKLISKAMYETLSEHTAPEISRCALDQTLLSLLFLGAEDGTGKFLQRLLDPPSKTSVNGAAASLLKLGAVQKDGLDGLHLTPLGIHLAGIPAPPTIGKLLVMGAILGCRTGALAMAAGFSVGRSPFLRVDGPSRGPTDESNRSILRERAALFEKCGNSDHAMLAAAFMTWQNTDPGGGGRKAYIDSLGLSFNGMKDIAQLASQYDSSLSAAGFASSRDSDRNGQSWRVLRTCAVASMAPNQLVHVVRPSEKYEETAEGSRLKQGEAKGHTFFIRVVEGEKSAASTTHRQQKEERVFIHPSSALFSVGSYSCPWLVFHSMIHTSKPFLRDATECSAYALLLFGGDLTVEARNNTILVDGWVHLSANARIGALIQGLRSKMDDLLQEKIENPAASISETPEMQLIVKLLKTDGLG